MTAKITLTWDNSSIDHVDQIVYRSAETFTVDNLPTILARVGRDAREYIDTDIESGNEYFYAVASENDVGDVLLSSVITVTAETLTGDPHWDNVVSLLHFDGDLTDEADPNRVWGGSYVESPQSGVAGSQALDKTASIWTPDSANNQPTPWVFYAEEATLEFFLQRDSAADNGNVISLWPSNIRFRCEIISSKLVFTAFIGSTRTMSFNLPFIDSEFEHIALVRNASGRFNVFRRGNILPEQYGPYTGVVHAGTGGSVTAGGVTFDELRITKGVARYTENFTPPTEPFPNY